MHRSHHALALGALVLSLVLVGCGSSQAAAPEPVVEAVTVTIGRGDVTQSVTATGTLQADTTTNLSFEVSGKVTAVYVKEGQSVAAGDPIAAVDDAALVDAVEAAQISLRSAQVQLEQAQEPASQAELDAARASLAQAKASQAALYEGPSDLERQTAQLNLDTAKNSLWAQQANRDAIAGNKMAASANKDAAEAAVLNAEVAVQQAQVALARLDEPPSASAVAAAEAQVAAAQAKLSQLLDLPNELAIKAAQVGVEKAELALRQAQDNLAKATLRAPFAGEITQVSLEIGDFATASVPVTVLVKREPLYLSAQIDEVDVADLAVGQRALATFDALNNQSLAAELTFLAPQGRVTSGIPNYDARVTLTEGDPRLRLGMSADLDIIIAEAKDAILVPNQAIESDRDAGKYYVTVHTPLGKDRREVQLGIQGTDYAEVLSGLSEGDTVELVPVATSNYVESPFMMGGGMPQ
ncbi:MAG: efflux RND transporter periplasmic adaptor subunit [Anaerolineales bacterium]